MIVNVVQDECKSVNEYENRLLFRFIGARLIGNKKNKFQFYLFFLVHRCTANLSSNDVRNRNIYQDVEKKTTFNYEAF